MNEEFDIRSLDFYTRQEARRQLITRVVMLAAVFLMLGANVWLTQRNYEAILVNINQSRLEAVALDEANDADIVQIDLRLRDVEEAIAACHTPDGTHLAQR